jgi:hypothetical protein
MPGAALRVVRPAAGVDLIAAEQAAEAFLVALGVDLDSENWAATPARMARRRGSRASVHDPCGASGRPGLRRSRPHCTASSAATPLPERSSSP